MLKKIINLLIISLSFSVNADDLNKEKPDLFTASYDSYYKGEHVGFMNREFKKENNQYVLKSISDIKGIYGILPVEDKRVEVSSFNIKDNGVYQPLHYRMDRTGTWLDFVMDINFDYEKNKVSFKYKDRSAEKDIVGEVLDNALFQLKMQQELKNGNRNAVRYDIAYKTGFKDFHFKYLGIEELDTVFGKVNAIKLKQVRKNKKGSEKAVYSWFDPDNDYVMIKFLYIDDSGSEQARFELKEYNKSKI